MIDLQFIGGGKMAEALIGGVLASESMAPGQIAVVEVSSARRDYLEKTFPGISVLSEPVAAHGVVLATKPAHVTTAIASAVAAGVERVLSIAAGISTEAL